MWILLISIITALAVALIANILSGKDKAGKPAGTEPPAADCCGAHEVCDKETLISHTRGDIVYFDDEELDAFKGKAPDQYSNKETDQIREVLETMHPNEVSLWLKSLMARGIKLPLNVREEALSIVKEQRSTA